MGQVLFPPLSYQIRIEVWLVELGFDLLGINPRILDHIYGLCL